MLLVLYWRSLLCGVLPVLGITRRRRTSRRATIVTGTFLDPLASDEGRTMPPTPHVEVCECLLGIMAHAQSCRKDSLSFERVVGS